MLSVITVSLLCSDDCRQIVTGIAAVYNITLGDHFAEHRHGLQSGAVPSTSAKLELTLIYSQLGSMTHCIHHLHTALTNLNLEQRHTRALSPINTVHILSKYQVHLWGICQMQHHDGAVWHKGTTYITENITFYLLLVTIF